MTTIALHGNSGQPHLCPVCGALVTTEPSYPRDHSTCPRCGQLLCWFRDRFGENLQLSDPVTALEKMGMDSLDLVELVMELEEESGVILPDDEWGSVHSIEDLLRTIAKYRRDQDETSEGQP